MRRPTLVALAAALALTLPLLVAPAVAAPDDFVERVPQARDGADLVDGPVDRALDAASGLPALETDEPAQTDGETDCGYASYAENPDDAAITLGLIPYHEIPDRLCEIEQSSDRVSVEVVGQSLLGRDLHLVEVTLPETAQERAAQEALRAQIVDDPEAALAVLDDYEADYRIPIFINNNIHGNEYEGTDASIELIERLADSDDPDDLEILERTRLLFIITNNPDGRVAGTRANAAGFDMNRDYVTQSQPEVAPVRDVFVHSTPVTMLDIHGYTFVTLIEPCTPPHNPNYEYDLYIRNALPHAEAMEEAVLTTAQQEALLDPIAAPVPPEVDIPFRDRDEGWDDWPPIFTPMFGMHQGAIGHTIELPHPVNIGTTEAYQPLARSNTIVGRVIIEASVEYTIDNARDLLADQMEYFRRGWAGEDSVEVPDGYVDGYGPEDRYLQAYPRGYVLPTGDDQASATAAARLADHLITNGVLVEQATEPVTVGGTSYPAGSYVVDMHQPRRGMANVMLEAGMDITERVDNMYDISAWSHGLLWGATVVEVPSGADLDVATTTLDAAPATGDVEGDGVAYAFTIDDGAGIRALNQLHDADVAVVRDADDTLYVDGRATATVQSVADATGVAFEATSSPPSEVDALRPLRLAAAVASDERDALRDLDYDFMPISTSDLNDGTSLGDIDVLVVSSGLSYGGLNDEGQAEVDAFLEDGGGVVGRGTTGANFARDAGLIEAEWSTAGSSNNGVITVTNDAGSPVTGSARDHSFVFGPMWFTSLGDDVAVDQRYGDDDPLVAGFWSGGSRGNAAGAPSVVRATEGDARAVLFATDPLFRNHPKGLYHTVGEAILWASSPQPASTLPWDDDNNGEDDNGPPAIPGLPGEATFTRYHGETRFETAAAISAATFAPGVEVAYVATGLDFADALAAGPVAGLTAGPVLLTASALPQATVDELERLDAGRIVVLGGPDAVPDAVLDELAELTDGSVDRLWGQTRFETAAAVSEATFDPNVPVAYVATGARFPDALTGGVPAGIEGGPVLLVHRDGIPDATAAELDRLKPGRITLLGGPEAINTDVEAGLGHFTEGAVTRLAGDDRFGTAAHVADEAFPATLERVFLATGGGFADALAGVSIAILAEGPIVLGLRDGVPDATADVLRRLEAAELVVLGGTAVISDASAQHAATLLAE